MKKILLLLTATLFLFGCAKNEDATPSKQDTISLRVPNSVKKGVGLTESTFGAVQLDSLGVSWYYNWGATTSITTTKTFVPICFSLNTIPKLTTTNTLLGFNEPDPSSQSNMSVATAIANWHSLTSKCTNIGSPATAGNPLTTGSWLTSFMNNNPKPKVDFVCVHWYKGCDVAKFKSDMTAIIAKYGKPIWITEFAPQTVSSSTSNPTKYSQTQVNAFINSVVPWMESNPMIIKYAWHNSKSGTSAIFTTTGQLTATGITYRDAH